MDRRGLVHSMKIGGFDIQARQVMRIKRLFVKEHQKIGTKRLGKQFLEKYVSCRWQENKA